MSVNPKLLVDILTPLLTNQLMFLLTKSFGARTLKSINYQKSLQQMIGLVPVKKMDWKEAVGKLFQGVLSFPELMKRSQNTLKMFDITPQNTLFANVTCRDEINKWSVDKFAQYWGENFDLAGLGGYPSAGITGFRAYMHHIPDGGNAFIFYGPHIGVNEAGEFGKVTRPGVSYESLACGALIGFLKKIQKKKLYFVQHDPLDSEQNLLEEALLSQRWTIMDDPHPICALTHHMYSVIDDKLHQILNRLEFENHLEFVQQIVLLGGIIINTPGTNDDFFAIKRAEIINAENIGEKVMNWLNHLVHNEASVGLL